MLPHLLSLIAFLDLKFGLPIVQSSFSMNSYLLDILSNITIEINYITLIYVNLLNVDLKYYYVNSNHIYIYIYMYCFFSFIFYFLSK